MGARRVAKSNQAQCKRANRPGRSFGAADDPAKHPFRSIPSANADSRRDAPATRASAPKEIEQGARASRRNSSRGCAVKQKWGREDDAGDFPSDRAVWTIGAFCVALLSWFVIGVYRYMRVWTPLQRHYLVTYAGTPPSHRQSIVVPMRNRGASKQRGSISPRNSFIFATLSRRTAPQLRAALNSHMLYSAQHRP